MESIIPIQIYNVGNGYHMKVDVLINGSKSTLILDTGASVSVFDETKIKKLVSRKIRTNGSEAAGAGASQIEQKEILIENIQIGFLNIEDYNAVVMDLDHINKSYQGLNIEEVDGILGSDILKFYDAVIDFSKKELVLSNF